MPQPITPDYTQQFLLPPSLEEWVPADHPARFVREVVEAMDLEAMGFMLPACTDGRPPYAPSLLLKIWVCGYVLRIRSSRKLEVACREQLSLLWLTGLIQPDHNSLWRFWRTNRAALREVFRQTVHLAVRSGCVGLAVQALDGTKLAAACSNHTGWTKEQMQRLLVQLEAALDEVELQVVTAHDDDPEGGYRLPAGLAERQALHAEIKAGLAQLAADGRNHYHPAEPEARRMKVGAEKRFAYNAQVLRDDKRSVITAAEVTRGETDVGQLAPMIVQGQQNLGVAATQAPETLADCGYGAGADLQEASAQGLPVLVPPLEGAPTKSPYAAKHFVYEASSHRVTCPEGRVLRLEGGTMRDGHRVERFRCPHRDCPVRAQCSRDPKGRHLDVSPHTAAVQAMRARLAEPQVAAYYQRRATLAEGAFAQIKQHDGFRRFTVWGWESVRTQWSLVCAAVNLRILYAQWRARLSAPTAPAPGATMPAAA